MLSGVWGQGVEDFFAGFGIRRVEITCFRASSCLIDLSVDISRAHMNLDKHTFIPSCQALGLQINQDEGPLLSRTRTSSWSIAELVWFLVCLMFPSANHLKNDQNALALFATPKCFFVFNAGC